jgi:isoleucyl-tRNA synthetase
VKEVVFLSNARGLVTLEARPNYRALGPRFGKSTNDAAEAIRGLSQQALAAYQDGIDIGFRLDGVTHSLREGDVEIVQRASGSLVVKGEGATTVALDPTLDEELLAEGIARELVNRIQRLRKDGGLDITDRINVGIAGPADVLGAAHVHRDFISRETLALDVAMVDALDGDGFAHVLEIDIDGSAAWIGLSVVTA